MSAGWTRVGMIALVAAMLAGVLALAVGSTAAADPAPEPEAPAAAGAAPIPVEPGVVRLLGRCVDARTSAPIAGCKIEARGWEPQQPWSERAGEEWEPEPFFTDAEGRFGVELRPPAGMQYWLRLAADGYVGLGHRVTLAPGTEEDVGDVLLIRGAKVTGRVVDTAGRPQANVALEFQAPSRQRELETGCSTLADGSFQVPDFFPPSTWSIDVGHRVALRSPLVFEVDDDVAPVELTIVVFADGEVTVNEGVVVDQDGKPVPDAKVTDGVVADAEGRFRHPCGPVSRWARWGYVWYFPEAPGLESVDTNREYALGDHSIRLRMRAPRTVALEVLVLDAPGGRPVEAFDVVAARRSRPNAYLPGWDAAARSLAPHGSGRARLHALEEGPYLVAVRPHGAATSAVQAVLVDLLAGEERLTLSLPALADCTVDVADADGRPIAGAFVELLLPLADGPVAVDAREVDALSEWPPLVAASALAVHTAHTAADGRALLRGPVDGSLGVRIAARGYVPEVRAQVRLPHPPLRFELRKGATLAGRLPPTLCARLGPVEKPARLGVSFGLRPRWPAEVGCVDGWASDACGLELHLKSTTCETSRSQPPAGYLFPIEPDGRFLITGLEAGDWTVRLQVPTSRRGMSLSLGDVDGLLAGESRRLGHQPEQLEPGELLGAVRADGRPWTNRLVCLRPVLRVAGGISRDEILCRTDGRGRFAARLPPGEWRLCVPAQGIRYYSSPEWIALPDEVEIRPAMPTVAEFAFARRRLTVRVVDAEGRPQPFRGIGLGPVSTLTDHEGRVVLDPALGEEITLSKEEREKHGFSTTDAGTLRIPAEPRHPEVTFVLK